MSVMVNLLPREVAVRKQAQRTTKMTVAAVTVFAIGLGGLYALKLGEIADAESQSDTVQADVSRLEAEVASLQQFRQLADELEARNAVLASAMANEISYARVLNDLALSFPASSSMRELTVGVQAPVEGQVTFGDAVAALTYDGYSTERYAPGVEAILVEFDKVRSFFSSYIGTAAVEEIGSTEVTGFRGTVQLGDEALTRRYENGLPEEMTP
jgi:outer membrane murein-binding lipoprotein Lpp